MKIDFSTAIMAAVLLCTASMAQASRTVVDQVQDPDDPNNIITVTDTLSGYCDLDGSGCQAQPLGYTVDFGGGNVADSFVVYGNGLFTFGSQAVDLADYANFDGTAGFFGGNAISAGIDNQLDFTSSPPVFYQSANVFFDAGSLNVIYYSCAAITGCSYGNGSDGYGFYLSAVADGLDIVPYAFASLDIAIPGVVSQPSGFQSFFIPARVTFGATGLPGTRDLPEPGSWALMIAGFALAGGALRRRPTRGGVVVA